MITNTLVTLSILLCAGSAAAQTCLHGAAERPGDRSLRDQAVRLAAEINRLEFAMAWPRATRKFLTLAELKLPLTPPGLCAPAPKETLLVPAAAARSRP